LDSGRARRTRELAPSQHDWLLQHPVGKRMGEVSFDFQGWLESFRNRRALAISMGISDAEFKHAEEFMQDGFELTDRILCNGDFYPRNLIKLTQKIVVVDWGYWAGYRACFVDYLVNVVAFAFVHMWNNDPWQKEFVGHVHSVFNPRPEDLRKAILIKAFEQASFWRGSCLVQPQINHFRTALKNEIPLD
jgi:hypothetical protein